MKNDIETAARECAEGLDTLTLLVKCSNFDVVGMVTPNIATAMRELVAERDTEIERVAKIAGECMAGYATLEKELAFAQAQVEALTAAPVLVPHECRCTEPHMVDQDGRCRHCGRPQ
jgi:hypothetical protein